MGSSLIHRSKSQGNERNNPGPEDSWHFAGKVGTLQETRSKK